MIASRDSAALTVRPPSLHPVPAAVLAMTGGTALTLARWLDPAPGERLLVVGATGGVDSYAVQLAAARGAHIIAVASGDDHDYARFLGAAETVDHRTQDTSQAVRAAHPDGINAVLDLVSSRETLADRIVPLLREGGRLATTVFAPTPTPWPPAASRPSTSTTTPRTTTRPSSHAWSSPTSSTSPEPPYTP
ncbi:zinc-binding dehydrogenase [Streptomyces melanogenes]|uniref:zinc-binding dehydrogenase n=1 Tax=Streptomyces melanogenes TaxID=67326 RepID=UPI00167C5AED|nr:zinc-binding dehydrogenase [Streptomyces melanogenes]GGP95136.1 hypothetical protein GCM10010278_86170 [Streptomyces melanogenes]